MSLTDYFTIPKRPTDVCMVYVTSKSGLNKALWGPSFPLPCTEALTDLFGEHAWMADIGIGEMFLNFPLDMHLREFC
jgi:hypothetical protein